MFDLARIRFVTARIPELYGLTAVPWCLYGLVDLAWHAGWLDWLPRNAILTASCYAVIALLLTILANVLIWQRYRALYGRVQHASRDRRVMHGLAVLLLFLVLTGVSKHIPGSPDLAMLFLGGCCWSLAARQPYRPHYFVLAGGAAALAGVVWVGLPQQVLLALYDVSFVVGLALAGVGDHLLLARTARPVVM